MSRLDPLVSEFETDEQADSYSRWFEAKVLEAMNSSDPRIPHDEAIALIDAMLAEKRRLRAGSSVE